MTYPAISRKDAQAVANQLLVAIKDGADPVMTLTEQDCSLIENRKGCEYDRTAVESFSESARAELLGDVSNQEITTLKLQRKTMLEAQMASRMHATVSELDMACLQDPDFWRYLALFPLRWFLLAREPQLKPQAFGGVNITPGEAGSVLSQGTSMKTQTVLRTYLWGKCAFDQNDKIGGAGVYYRRATAINGKNQPSTIDVWHSHMIRTQIGQMGHVPQAFIDLLAERGNASTDDARELAKLINRMKHNVLLDAHSHESALGLVAGQLPDAKMRVEAFKAEKEKKKH